MLSVVFQLHIHPLFCPLTALLNDLVIGFSATVKDPSLKLISAPIGG